MLKSCLLDVDDTINWMDGRRSAGVALPCRGVANRYVSTKSLPAPDSIKH